MRNIFYPLAIALPLCFIAGALSALAMAPTNVWGILFLTLPVLYLALHHAKSKKAAFAAGWLFGFGYFVFGLFWIGNALLIDGNPYQWAWPLAVCGLPAVLAFFPAFAALVIRQSGRLHTLTGWGGFAALFSLSEWLRGHLFTGFPWNLFGYTWADNLPILQVLSFTDVYGLTFLTLLWASLPAFLLLTPSMREKHIGTALALSSFCACFAFGVWRLEVAPLTFHDNLNIRLVQPNINQAEKWDSAQMSAHFDKHLRLSRAEDGKTDKKQTTFIIWPETALSFRFSNDPFAMAALEDTLKTYAPPATLFTGLLSYDPASGHYSNALAMIDATGTIQNQYNKSHLVPFGEYIPFQKWIPLAPIAAFHGFHTGNGPETFNAPNGLKYSALVCYEILFPGASHASTPTPPDFIINVTNDAWYGISPGPYQHFTQAQFRAIESGMPVIRSANTGFSGIMAPNGTKIGVTTLFTESGTDIRLPRKETNFVTSPVLKTILFLGLTFCLAALSVAKRFF